MFPGGALAFVADAGLAGAVFTTLPPATALLSSDLSINFLKPAFPSSGSRIAVAHTQVHEILRTVNAKLDVQVNECLRRID